MGSHRVGHDWSDAAAAAAAAVLGICFLVKSQCMSLLMTLSYFFESFSLKKKPLSILTSGSGHKNMEATIYFLINLTKLFTYMTEYYTK